MKIGNLLAVKGSNVITISDDRGIREAVALLSRHNIGALVVVNNSGAPIGILSERDIVREAARTEAFLTLPVTALMTKKIITGTPQDDLNAALETMTKGDFRHLPIIDDGKLAGIISIGDAVKAQLQQYRGEIDTLETRVTEG